MRQQLLGIAASAALVLAPGLASAHGGVSIGGHGGHGGIHWQIQVPIQHRHHRPRHHSHQLHRDPHYWQNHYGAWWRHRQHHYVPPRRHYHGGKRGHGGGHRYRH